MADDRYVFPSLVEGLIKGLGPLATPTLLAKVKAAGIDVDRPPPAISAPVIRDVINVMAREAFPHLSPDDAKRQVGVHFIQGWQRTLLGSAASAMLKLIGVQRALGRMERGFRTADNFSAATVTMRGPTHALVTIQDMNELPTYWLGIFEAMLVVMGLKGTATLEKTEGSGGTINLQWQ